MLLSIGLILFLTSISLPGFHYVRCLNSQSLLKPPENELFSPSLTIFLPVRNESTLICSKIDELLRMELDFSKTSILIVDSCSTDDTKEIAENHLSKVEPPLNWHVTEIPTPGKSYAVNYALENIDSEFMIMVDADAILPSNSLKKILRWFTDPTIGAVCGKLDTSRNILNNQYRRRFNSIRLGESAIDSTPIFEGSICGFRTDAIGKSRINPRVNADDTQLSIIVRRNGFKAIMDSSVIFKEARFGIGAGSSSRRSTRRAQGISRVLWLNRDILSFPDASYRRIFQNQFYFYLLFPWLLLASITMIVSSMIWWMSLENVNPSLIAITVFSITMAASYFRISRELIGGAYYLVKSHILLFLRIRLNSWIPDEERRKKTLQMIAESTD